MKVLLDATAIPADLGGVGRYVDDLVPELIASGVNLAMAVQQRDVAHFSTKVPRAHLFPVSESMESRGARMAWEQTGLPALIHRIRPDDSQSGRGHQTSKDAPGPAGHGIGLLITTMSRGR